MASRLLLVRHAETPPRYAGRYLGRSNVSLAPGAFDQARALAPVLRRMGVKRCFCSPLRRAMQTAQAATEALGLSIQIDEDLREADLGDWEGHTFQEIAASWPAEVNRWAQLAPDFTFPNGESMQNFLQRCRRAADRLAAEPADVVLAITHGGVIRSVTCYLLGLEARHYLLFEIKTATITSIDVFNAKGVLTGLNLGAS